MATPNKNVVISNFWAEPEVESLAKQEYHSFFKEVNIGFHLGALVNKSTQLGCYPPHTDHMRSVTINYYIDIGGSDIDLLFYDKQSGISIDEGGKLLSYDSLPPVIGRYKPLKGNWYAFNARQFHSVENIEKNRYILSFSIFNLSFDDFKHKFNTLIE